MSSWIPFMRSKDKKTSEVIATFEKDLKKISSNINSLNIKVSHTSRQLKNVKNQFLLYSSTVYSIYLLYFAFIVRLSGNTVLHAILTITIPFLISFINSSIVLIYNKRINSYNSKIEILKEQHQSKIDDLKEATNFNKTQDLLLKFSDDADDLEQKKKEQEEFFNKLEMQIPTTAHQQQFETSKPTVIDRLLNVVIGEDEYSASKRYALICPACHLHNGLAPPGELAESVKYVCPNCGRVNNDDVKEESPKEDDDFVNIEGVDGSTSVSKGLNDVL